MKFLKRIISAFFLVFLMSCNEESSVVKEQVSKDDNLVFHYQNKAFKIGYSVNENGEVAYSALPKELINLKNNKELSLKVIDNKIWLVEDASVKSSVNTFSKRPEAENETYTNFMNRFGFESINHYGFVARDLRSTMLNYMQEYNVKKCWYKPMLKQKKYFFEDGVDLNYSVNLAFGFSGKKQIEILVTTQHEDNIFGNFLKEKEGLHHIGFSVKNLDETTKNFTDKGYKVIVSGEFITKLGMVSKLKFFDTREEIGAYTEIVESKLLGFNVTQDESLLIVGLILGDVQLICL